LQPGEELAAFDVLHKQRPECRGQFPSDEQEAIEVVLGDVPAFLLRQPAFNGPCEAFLFLPAEAQVREVSLRLALVVGAEAPPNPAPVLIEAAVADAVPIFL
jgi:hypothetical protein